MLYLHKTYASFVQLALFPHDVGLIEAYPPLIFVGQLATGQCCVDVCKTPIETMHPIRLSIQHPEQPESGRFICAQLVVELL